MDRDSEWGVLGDGGDNITYGEGRWGWLIGETKNRILDSRWFRLYDLAHFIQILHDFFRTIANRTCQPFAYKLLL